MTPQLLCGRYAIERRLGGGGMAEVFLARTVGAEGFTRRVAIKRVLPGMSGDPQFARMFTAEAQLCSRLLHQNIVSVLDFDRDEHGNLFLVMELVEGVDLSELLQTGRIPLPAVVFITSEVLHGLGHAHDLPGGLDGMRGLVHRDVSPSNVLLSWQGCAKVSDFGIAKALSASVAAGSVMVKGKPAYMSPEQARGEPLDGTSDLFAVGVMIWEMVCGHTPFGADTLEETLSRLLFGAVPSPRAVRPDLPDEIERIVMRLLDRDRSQRYVDANAAIADLTSCRDYPVDGRTLLGTLLAERFPGRAPVRVPELKAARASARASAPVAVVPEHRPARAPRGSTARRRIAIAAVIGLAGAGAGILSLAHQPEAGSSPARAPSSPAPRDPGPPAEQPDHAAASPSPASPTEAVPADRGPAPAPAGASTAAPATATGAPGTAAPGRTPRTTSGAAPQDPRRHGRRQSSGSGIQVIDLGAKTAR